MPKVSKYKLDKTLENEIMNQFWYSLGLANDSVKAKDFYSDLLSEMEQMMLAKRLATAVLITRGKSPAFIHDSIHLSYSAIASVSSWVKNSKNSTNKLLKQISNEKGWEIVIDKIEEILDSTHPLPGTDWASRYEDIYKRKKLRSARKALR